jgi:hypothetical protein
VKPAIASPRLRHRAERAPQGVDFNAAGNVFGRVHRFNRL